MKRADAPEIRDDLPLAPLVRAIGAEIKFLEKAPASLTLHFGRDDYSKAEYLEGLRHFAQLAQAATSFAELNEVVRRDFVFYEVYGQQDWGDVFMTSYYEPVLHGSLKPTPIFTQALYQVPDDLLSLNLTPFDPKFADERKLRGRLQGKAFVPYFTREEIDLKGALRGRRLELCYVDPIDAFTLQIQGSGTIDLGWGQMLKVNYAEKNGQRYDSIGNFLRDVIPPERMGMPAIEGYLRHLLAASGMDALQAMLDKNASYVFFKSMPQEALTYLGVPATAGRTIATDPHYFPKGALAFLVSPKPEKGEGEEISRFLLDQDTGGAIKGPGRLDLFWGRGAEAGEHAGKIQQRGRLYYLAPIKQGALSR